MSTMEPTYTRRDAEDIFAAAKVESGTWWQIRSVQSLHGGGRVVIDDSGVWPDEGTIGMLPSPFDPGWKPCHELESLPGQPGPRETPGLPFPFTARQFAAFMLDGAGWLVKEGLGEWADGPNLRLLSHPEHVKAHEAVHAAYAAYRKVATYVAEIDAALMLAVRQTTDACAEAEAAADLKYAPRARGITEVERGVRWSKYLAAVEAARGANTSARQAYWAALAVWRKAMVVSLCKRCLFSSGESADLADVAGASCLEMA